ncbi:MAG: transketolase family protein, partial [Clostridiales bacterium]|nr:transketolase family protein [Clostridiales bacterium]
RDGINAAVIEYPTIKPFDQDTLVSFAKKTNAVITVEEHTIIGGLGGVVAETLSDNYPVKMKRIGIEDCFGESGPYDSLLEKNGLTSKNIYNSARELIGR